MRIILGALVALLFGCTTVQSSNFKDMSAAYREVIEQYANDNILLNIVRASKNMPMSFLDIPSVVGTGYLTGSANLSANVITSDPTSVTGFFSAGRYGAISSSYSPSVGMSVSNSFTFTQASLDNAQFMSAFLKEVPLDTINFRGTESDLPKAVLYSLLIDNVQLRSDDDEIIASWRNDPLGQSYKNFQELFYLLIDIGVTTEVKVDETPIGPLITEQQMLSNLNSVTDVASKPGSGLTFAKRIVNGKIFYQLIRLSSQTRLCVNKYRAQKILGDVLSSSSYCADSPKILGSTSDYKDFLRRVDSRYAQRKNLQLLIKLRSTGNVFDYLGQVLNAQTQTNSFLVTIRTPHSPSGKHTKVWGEYPLLKIYKNIRPDDPIYSVNYRGDVYSVDGDDSSFSSKVLEFVYTLIAATKIPGAVPATPAIVVR